MKYAMKAKYEMRMPHEEYKADSTLTIDKRVSTGAIKTDEKRVSTGAICIDFGLWDKTN